MILTDGYSLEIVLGGAMSTAHPAWLVSYGDVDATTRVQAGGDTPGGHTNGTTPVEMLPDPGAGVETWIRYISLINRDDVAIDVEITKTDGVTPIEALEVTLQPGDSAVWTPEGGWRVFDSTGALRITWSGSLGVSQIALAQGGLIVGDAGGLGTTLSHPGAANRVLVATSSTALGWSDSLALPGTLLRGHTALLAMGGAAPDLQSHGTGDAGSRVGLGRWSADATGPRWVTGKSRGGIGSHTIVQSGDSLGAWDAVGADGVDLATVAGRLQWQAFGTPAANRVAAQLALFLAPAAADDDISTTVPHALWDPQGVRFSRVVTGLPFVRALMSNTIVVADNVATVVLTLTVPNPSAAVGLAATIRGTFLFHTRSGASYHTQTVELVFQLMRHKDLNTQLGAIAFGTAVLGAETGTAATQANPLSTGMFALAISAGAATATQTITLSFTNNFDDGILTHEAMFTGWMYGGAVNAGFAITPDPSV